jgi:hypothetical protein
MNRRIVIWGPPNSGKTTYAVNHAQRGDLIWDFDIIHMVMMPGGLPDRFNDFPVDSTAALRAMRDAFVEWLERTHYVSGDVYVIVTQEATARRIAAQIGGELVAMARVS